MSFLRLPEPVIVVVEPAVMVFGVTSFTTASVEASPQSVKDTAKAPLPATSATSIAMLGSSRPVHEPAPKAAVSHPASFKHDTQPAERPPAHLNMQ